MMADKKGVNKVGFEKLFDGSVETSYFNDCDEVTHKAWTLPGNVAGELISWWKKLDKEKGIHPPIKEKGTSCEFTVHTENYIDIEEYFVPSSPKKNFWTLSIDTVDELVNWAEKKT